MRRSAFLLPLSLVLVAGVTAELQLDRSSLEESFFRFATTGAMYPPRVPAALRASGGLQRATAVKGWCAELKTYYASERFRQRYAEWWKTQQPKEEKARSADDMIAAQDAQMAKALKELAAAEAQIKNMPPEMQAQMRESLAQARVQLSQMPKAKREDLAQNAALEAQGKKRDYADKLAAAPDRDPKVQLRKALTGFLSATEGIDYGAALVDAGHQKRFAKDDYEGKSKAWKMGFRAGKDATETARAFARQWLAELK